jgi:hypothetical protein
MTEDSNSSVDTALRSTNPREQTYLLEHTIVRYGHVSAYSEEDEVDPARLKRRAPRQPQTVCAI